MRDNVVFRFTLEANVKWETVCIASVAPDQKQTIDSSMLTQQHLSLLLYIIIVIFI